MQKNEILNLLKANHMDFIAYVDGLSEKDFNRAPAGKWDAGQQLEHIILSIRPLNLAFLLPSFMFKWLYGKANRPSKTYEELVAKYNSKIAEGGSATAPFRPKNIAFYKKPKLILALKNRLETLLEQLDGYTEEQLDAIILPHPLLGKITLREMAYFTAYHVEHHQRLIKKGIETA